MSDAFQQWLSDLAQWGHAAALRLAHHEMPDLGEVLNNLGRLGILQGVLMVLIGAVYLLWGAKVFKFLVTLNLAILGMAIGSSLGALHSAAWSLYGAVIAAVVLAILAWPLMKFAVSLMGAAAGAFAGYQLWRYFTLLYRPDLTQYVWIGELAGALLVGAMAFVLFRTVIMLFTSLQGAVLAVAGGVAVALQCGSIAKPVHHRLLTDTHLLPLLVIATTLLGFFFQVISLARKKAAPPAEAAKGKGK